MQSLWCWQTFNEVQRLLSKTNGQVVGDVMTPAPLVVRESTNLEDVARFCDTLSDLNHQYSAWLIKWRLTCLAFVSFIFTRLLLKTKYRRLPVVDADGKLVRTFYPVFTLVFRLLSFIIWLSQSNVATQGWNNYEGKCCESSSPNKKIHGERGMISVLKQPEGSSYVGRWGWYLSLSTVEDFQEIVAFSCLCCKKTFEVVETRKGVA